jgi:hypothetical protein
MNDLINAVLFKEPKAPANTPPLLLFFFERARQPRRPACV